MYLIEWFLLALSELSHKARSHSPSYFLPFGSYICCTLPSMKATHLIILLSFVCLQKGEISLSSRSLHPSFTVIQFSDSLSRKISDWSHKERNPPHWGCHYSIMCHLSILYHIETNWPVGASLYMSLEVVLSETSHPVDNLPFRNQLSCTCGLPYVHQTNALWLLSLLLVVVGICTKHCVEWPNDVF